MPLEKYVLLIDAEPLSNKRNPKFLATPAGIAFLKKIHTCAPLPERDLSTKGSASINLKSFHYYDRMYPSQDVANGIGNLIALPLKDRHLKMEIVLS